MNDCLIDHFTSQWRFVRSLTNDLLESILDEDLLKTPALALGPWWKQFRHMGRVQENYLQAIDTGTVRFGFEGTSYKDGAAKNKLKEYLGNLDKRLNTVVESGKETSAINWFGERKSLAQHLLCLADHEILHHGQWIVYQKQLGGNFPPSWSAWGL